MPNHVSDRGGLPVMGAESPERADAALNRRRILAAAQRLFESRGVGCTSMDAIAGEAGVGKGTLFRRFGDRAGLARALVDEGEQAFQEQFIRGAPPLGPGAPPADRLIAFGEGLIDHLEAHGEIIAAAEFGPAELRLGSAPYLAYRTHVLLLVAEAAPEADGEFLADALLATLSGGQFRALRTMRGMSVARIKAAWRELVRRLLGPADA
ncbi:MAG TPA: helix-turn-helix domain-containing protein [Solirubrobacteraceae bacterium]|nr:helix-turn-helix domain-containing protein [Solirubrobacteraceae bacterium]